MTRQPAPHQRVTALLAGNIFFAGLSVAATVSYAGIIAIERLGIPNAMYSILLIVSALVSAGASVLLGYMSDRVGDRRVIAIASALVGAIGYTIIFFIRTAEIYTVVTCVLLPFGGAIYAQTFAYARAFYDRHVPARAEFMNQVMRMVFSLSWVIAPPVMGLVAATTDVFNLYAIAALTLVVCALLFVVIPPEGTASVPEGANPQAARAEIDLVVMAGLGGVLLIYVANQIYNICVPLLVTTTLGATYADFGLVAGVAAAIEIPFMLAWGYALRWMGKHTVIVIAALMYAVYLTLLSRAGSVSDLLWLQIINGPATAALMSITISYMQDAVRNRVGLSTSLLDVVRVASVIACAGLFAWLTGARPDYPAMFVAAGILSGAGAVLMFAAHRMIPARPAVAAP